MSLQVSGSYIDKLFWDNLFREFEERQLRLVSLEKRRGGRDDDSVDCVGTLLDGDELKESREHAYDLLASR